MRLSKVTQSEDSDESLERAVVEGTSVVAQGLADVLGEHQDDDSGFCWPQDQHHYPDEGESWQWAPELVQW